MQKRTVYTTCQRRFINEVNAVDCSQQRIQLTETRSLPPWAMHSTGSIIRRTAFKISSSQLSLSLVELSLSHPMRPVSPGVRTVKGHRIYTICQWILHLARANGLTSCNIGPSIVASNLQISWFLILSSSSWWYLTRFAMLLAWWCQIGQLWVIHFACGLGSSKPCNPPPHYPLRVSGMGGGQTARGHTRGGQTRRGQTRREDTGPGQTGRWQPGWHAMAEQLTPWVGSAAWEGSALGVWFAVGGSLSLGGGSSGGVGLSMGVQMEELGLKGCSYPELSNCPEGSGCPKGPGAQKVQM